MLVAFFQDGNCSERRSILIYSKDTVITFFVVQTFLQIVPVKKKATFQAHGYANRPRA